MKFIGIGAIFRDLCSQKLIEDGIDLLVKNNPYCFATFKSRLNGTVGQLGVLFPTCLGFSSRQNWTMMDISLTLTNLTAQWLLDLRSYLILLVMIPREPYLAASPQRRRTRYIVRYMFFFNSKNWNPKSSLQTANQNQTAQANNKSINKNQGLH